MHRLFAATGRSVGEHINDRRVFVCARNLLDTGGRHKKIADIAFDAGFRDISHFNRIFKRSHGLAPRDFRRAIAGKAE